MLLRIRRCAEIILSADRVEPDDAQRSGMSKGMLRSAFAPAGRMESLGDHGEFVARAMA
jgi:hypothetical protein